MSKFIGVKMVEAIAMIAGEARAKGYRVNKNYLDTEGGYEVTYEGGYKSWSPADVFEKYYYKLNDVDGNSIIEKDVKSFVRKIDNVKVGTKTTNTTLTCLTSFEVHGQASCVNPENYDINVGANYAQIKAEDKIWEGLGFVLQWAKYGLNRNEDKKDIKNNIPPHIQRVINEHKELQDKIDKLDKFIVSNPIFSTLSSDEQADMENQLQYMLKYDSKLVSRLKRAGYLDEHSLLLI